MSLGMNGRASGQQRYRGASIVERSPRHRNHFRRIVQIRDASAGRLVRRRRQPDQYPRPRQYFQHLAKRRTWTTGVRPDFNVGHERQEFCYALECRSCER